MCDYGRMNYRWVNRQDRAELPMVRANGVLAATEWETGITAAAQIISRQNVT